MLLRLLSLFIPSLFEIILSVFLVRSMLSELAMRLAWPTESPSVAAPHVLYQDLKAWLGSDGSNGLTSIRGSKVWQSRK